MVSQRKDLVAKTIAHTF